MKNSVLITMNIFWKKHPINERYFYFSENHTLILLRINDFPDEPLGTLINGLDILDIDDIPIKWVLEKL